MRAICAVLVAAAIGCAGESHEVRPSRAKLDVDDIVRGMEQVKPAVNRCFDLYKASGLFSVGLTIVGDGHVASVRVRGPHVPTNDCVGHAVATAEFPPFSGPPQSVVYPFVLR